MPAMLRRLPPPIAMLEELLMVPVGRRPRAPVYSELEKVDEILLLYCGLS